MKRLSSMLCAGGVAMALVLGNWSVQAEDAGGAGGGGAKAANAEAAKKARLATVEKKRAELAEKKAESEARKKKAQEEAAAKRAELEAKRQEAESARETVVDKREERQGKRIQQGINKGYLTPDEITKLQTQQTGIANLEASLKSDEKLSKGDAQQLRTQLDTASRCIWGEKHDTDGKQMATYRLGTNVFAKDSLTQKMANENLSPVEAKVLLKDFHRTVELKRLLATGSIAEAQRAKLQAEYNDLLNQYFEVR